MKLVKYTKEKVVAIGIEGKTHKEVEDTYNWFYNWGMAEHAEPVWGSDTFGWFWTTQHRLKTRMREAIKNKILMNAKLKSTAKKHQKLANQFLKKRLEAITEENFLPKTYIAPDYAFNPQRAEPEED